MPEYLITPKAPLVFRDGKPFGTTENMADTLNFPLPSTISGALRTAWAESQSDGFDYSKDAKKLTGKRVLGPLLVKSNNQGQHTPLFPAPADSLCLNSVKTGSSQICRLHPDTLASDDEGTDLPHNDLIPVFLDTGNKSKPANNPPAFWTLGAMTEWLAEDKARELDASQQGVRSLPVEVRTHVTIKPETQTAKDGHLFQTAGIDFSHQRNSTDTPGETPQFGWQDGYYSLVSWFQEELPNTCRTIGGEARLGQIQACPGLWPECPPELADALIHTNSFRLILATPAIFNKGYLPGFLDDNLRGELGNLPVQLKAVATPRWQAGTSWDMADSKSKHGKAMRTTQRLVPAGAVYWFDILENKTGAELQEHWLTSISDERNNDGFGLILPGVWTKNSKRD